MGFLLVEIHTNGKTTRPAKSGPNYLTYLQQFASYVFRFQNPRDMDVDIQHPVVVVLADGMQFLIEPNSRVGVPHNPEEVNFSQPEVRTEAHL